MIEKQRDGRAVLRIGLAVDHEIEEPLPAQDAQYQFGGQARILGFDRTGQFRAQGLIGIGVLLGDAQ